jgi:prepilin-type N-terminal cleavage/methylation domain-containing protein
VRRHPRGRAQAGLTLIELAVVLGILAVAGALVLPAVGRGTGAARVRGEASRVAALLREARLRAVTARVPVRVTLDRARNVVAMEPDGAGAEDGEPRGGRQVALAPGLRVRVAAGGEALTFSPRGFARDTRWVVEAAGGRRLAVRVEAVTGRVTVGPEPS